MTKKQQLRKRADKLWYELLLVPECEICGKPARQVHHYFFKSSYGHLRYDLDNGISMCQSCHFVLHAQDSKKIEALIIERRGKKWHNKLQKKAQTPPPPSYQTIGYYEDIIKKLQ